MSQRFIEHMDRGFEKWTPRQQYTIYKDNMKDEKLVEVLQKILEKLEQIDWKLYEFYKSMIDTEEEEDV